MARSPYEEKVLSGGLGEFGQMLVQRVFDGGMRDAIGHLEGLWKSWHGTSLHKELGSLNPDQRAAVQSLVELAITSSLHNFLHTLSTERDKVQLRYLDVDVAKDNDGLHGDLFIWIEEYSRFARNVLVQRLDESLRDVARSRPSSPPSTRKISGETPPRKKRSKAGVALPKDAVPLSKDLDDAIAALEAPREGPNVGSMPNTPAPRLDGKKKRRNRKK